MNKFKTWIIPVLIAVLALGALIYFKAKPSPQEVTQKPGVPQAQQVAAPKGFAKAPEPTPQQKAKLNADAMVVALNSGNVADCEKIVWSDVMRKQCEDSINYGAIVRSGNEDQCANLSDPALKANCYNKIYMSSAVDSKDPKICEKISDSSLKQMCLDQVQMLVSRYANSAKDCAVITSVALRKQCEDSFYLKASTQSLTAEGCNNISDPQLMAQCKKTVANNVAVLQQSKQAAEKATTTKTLSEILALCKNLTGAKATSCEDAVYPQMAFDEKNLSYCDKISDPDKVAECRRDQGDKINTYFLRQALASSDKSLCNQISDQDLKQLCQKS